ncbi:MAG TPA: glycosyltransferase [Casimicrobiaceae bacterium]|nr:glycosyltransferase [Casimicrobiaceae bacterium]
MDSPPLVSVIVRSMDPPTLPRALASIARQDHPAIEVVLVAACGRSHRPVDASQYPFALNFVASDEPLSRPRAANAGLDASHGEFITFLDHDDELLDGHLSGLVAALAKDPVAGVAYGRFEVFEEGRHFSTIGRPFDRLALHEKSYIHHSALLFRRRLVATGVRYDEALDIHDDWDFVLQLSEKTTFRFVDQCAFRWHADIGTSGGGGKGNFDPDKFSTQYSYVREKWGDVLAAHVTRFNALVERGVYAAQKGALDEAQTCLTEALDDAQDDPDLLNMVGMVAQQRGDVDKSRRMVERALALRADDPRLWFNFGLACASGNDNAEARRAFSKVLSLAPGHTGAQRWLAQLR